jgi:hypothetical protein
MMCILLLKTIGEQDLQLILNVGNKKTLLHKGLLVQVKIDFQRRTAGLPQANGHC